MSRQIGRYVGLLIVSGLALAIAVTVTASGWKRVAPQLAASADLVIPETPVSVMQARLESIEITDSYSGMIRPWERYSLGFEVAGRVVALGTDASGEPLDEGARVAAGDVLARLDDRVFRARLEEATAQLEAARARRREAGARLEKAQSDMNRSDRLRRSGSRAITEAEYQDAVTQLALAESQLAVVEAELNMAAAQRKTAQKNLLDATLVAPVDGVISKRLVNAGESVVAQQAVMEIIQVEQVLLVVGVPEAYVGEILPGQKVHVELLARDRFRQKRPRTTGRVRRVAEAADQTTGLFEVEILVENSGGDWKPGLIALAHIVLKEVQGFAVPMTSAVYRDEKMYLFTAAKDGKALTKVGESGEAHRLELSNRTGTTGGFPPAGDGTPTGGPSGGGTIRYIEQGSDLILLDLPSPYRAVVTRGQHRLMKDRPVKVVSLEERPIRGQIDLPVRGPAKVAGTGRALPE